MVIFLALLAGKRLGFWVGVLALVSLVAVGAWVSKASKRLSGAVLGCLFGLGTWKLLERDYAQEGGLRAFCALLVLALFCFAGHLEAKREA